MPDEILSGSYCVYRFQRFSGDAQDFLYICEFSIFPGWSVSVVFSIASIRSRVVVVLILRVSIVRPRKFTVVSLCELFFRAKIGFSPASPGLKTITHSEASDAEATSANLSSGDSCAFVQAKLST